MEHHKLKLNFKNSPNISIKKVVTLEFTEQIIVRLIAIAFLWPGIEIYLGHQKFFRLVAGNIFGDSNDEVAKHHKGIYFSFLSKKVPFQVPRPVRTHKMME